MGTNYNQVDWYTNFTIVLAAGESRKINKLGRYVTILSNNNSDDPRIQINGQNGGKIPSGLSLELPESENFDRLELTNESANAMTLEVALSNGKIIDSRTVLSGAVDVYVTDKVSGNSADVVTGSTNALRVYDANAKGSHDLLDGSQLEVGDHLLKGFTDLSNASFYYFTGTVTAGTDIVTAAANTNGIIIHRAEFVPNTSGPIELSIDGDEIAVCTGYYNGGNSSTVSSVLENYIVGSGKALEIYSASTNGRGLVVYETL